MNKKIRILHLEDSLSDSELIRSLIESGGIEHEYLFANNEKDFLNILETENIDLILSDYNLPDYNGNEALKAVKEKYSHIPFIFVSGMMGEDAAIHSLLNGATDYVLKNKLERLVPAIQRAIHETEIEQARIQSEEELKKTQHDYRQLFEMMIEGFALHDIICDKTGKPVDYKFLAVNPGFEKWTGLKSGKILGKTVKEVLPGTEDYWIERYGKVAINGEPVHFEEYSKDLNKYFQVSAFRPAPMQFAVVFTDITDQKKYEEGLKQAKEKAEEMNRVKSYFLSNMSHELR